MKSTDRWSMGRYLTGAVLGVVVLAACSAAPRSTESVGTTGQRIVGGLGNVTVTTAGTIVNRYSALTQGRRI